MLNNDYKQFNQRNPYFGKYFSILGDSISTFEGYNPEGYNIFYTHTVCHKALVHSYKDTWWGTVIDFLGGKLLINNSWSGSCVTKWPHTDSLFPSGCSRERTSALHVKEIQPDVIIVYLGTNDFARGVEPACSPSRNKPMLEYFDVAYFQMLSDLRKKYPLAEIWCCTLGRTSMATFPEFVFPENFGGVHIDEYNRIICRTATKCKCRIIDLNKFDELYATMDGTHPTADGMNTLARTIIREMLGHHGIRETATENNLQQQNAKATHMRLTRCASKSDSVSRKRFVFLCMISILFVLLFGLICIIIAYIE